MGGIAAIRSRALFSILVLSLAASAEAADWSAYKRTSVAQAWSEAAIVDGATYTIDAANAKYAVEAEYTGQHRTLQAGRQELLRRWVKAVGHPPEYATMFAHEIQIRASKQAYWLPLQNAPVEPFAREAAAGSRLRLHIMYVGAAGKEPVFVVNRFEVLPK